MKVTWQEAIKAKYYPDHQNLTKYIQESIIEKLIEDIPAGEWIQESATEGISVINLDNLKQQLRDKWL